MLPDSLKARFLLGSLYLVRRQPAEALEHLEWVAKRDSKNVVARANLGNTYLALSRRPEAIREFQTVLSLQPGNTAALRGLKILGLTQ